VQDHILSTVGDVLRAHTLCQSLYKKFKYLYKRKKLHIVQAPKKKSQVAHDFFEMFGNEFDKACNDAKWVEIELKGIDAFMKRVNTHIDAIDARTKGELEVGGNVLALSILPRSKLQVFTLTHVAFNCHKFKKVLVHFAPPKSMS